MPKLKDQTLERNQLRIEEAALEMFTQRGFHGTSVRDIAERAGTSLGNLYNYYPTKEEIYLSLVRKYSERMSQLQRERLLPILGRFDQESMGRLAEAVREIVTENSDYWRLMCIDVVEFQNVHFAHLFQDLPEKMKAMKPEAFASAEASNGVPAEFAFASIYLQFFLYYLVETLFGGRQHMGVAEHTAIDRMIHLSVGAWNGAQRASIVSEGADATEPAARDISDPRRSRIVRRAR